MGQAQEKGQNESCMGCPEKVLLEGCFCCLNPFSSCDMGYREQGGSAPSFVAETEVLVF